MVQVGVSGKSYYEVLQEYLPEWCLQRECHINSIKTCDQSPDLYEYSTLHNRSCTIATSFPTHTFTYILPGILYHPDVEIQSIMRVVALTRWHVPCTEPIMITAILANLWRFDCQIDKNIYFSLRYRSPSVRDVHCYLPSRKSPDPTDPVLIAVNWIYTF